MPLTKTGIIIQARAGSSRLPGKMLMPFYKGLTILEIIVKNLLDHFDAEQIIVATTLNSKDDAIENAGKELGVHTFRGSENDVLDRFISAAEYFGLQNIIRVCGDNPFLQAHDVKFLSEQYLPVAGQTDYMSFAFPDGTPVIKSHLGLFTEATNLPALKKVVNLTGENLYHEHVTNYMYAHPGNFTCSFLSLPDNLKDRKDLRMTIDTLEDFNLMKEIFENNVGAHGYHISVSEIISYIYKNKNILNIMANEIERNSK
jgi:spore coat polysaccharide biosynthesis protein SpsF (cytidylyltransferase family)